MPDSVTVTVSQRDDQLSRTGKGKPKLGCKVSDGRWIQVMGDGIADIRAGDELVLSEPAQFGKSWFATLKEIKAPPDGQAPSDGVPTWDHCEQLIRKAHELALELEPDGYAEREKRIEVESPNGEPHTEPLVVVDRSRARMAFVSTLIIAFTNRKIAADEPSGSPF